MPKKINNCTLFACDCYNYAATVTALKKSMAQNEFDRVIFFTDIPIELEGIEVIQIPSIRSKRAYSHFIVKELWKHISTDYTLCVQHDGFTLNGDLFDERLYNYDYCGSLWLETDGYANGNGGYSWKSRRLLEAVGKDDFIKATHPEDAQLCRTYRDYLEITHGLKWASDEVCERFAFELREPINETMGFHGYFHKPYRKTVVVKRMAAAGDCVKVEPILAYFHSKGYRVVLDTLPQFHLFFINHYFKVHRLQEIDQRVLSTAKYVNLDGSYEAEPHLNHTVAYFKYAGITEPGEFLRKPKLSLGFPINDETRLFPNSCVIHIDKRQGGRNQYGIEWGEVVKYLNKKGFTVIQIGKGEHEVVEGAVQINITNENFLCYVVGSAKLFVGIDSAPSNIAVAFNVPSVIFFGAVDANKIHIDLENIEIVDNGTVCDTPKCWHLDVGNTEGRVCYIDESRPPCATYTTEQVINAINNLTCN